MMEQARSDTHDKRDTLVTTRATGTTPRQVEFGLNRTKAFNAVEEHTTIRVYDSVRNI